MAVSQVPARVNSLLRIANGFRDSEKALPYLLVAAAFVAALGARWKLFPFYTGDYTDFYGPWFDFLKLHGFSGLGQHFADYNPPFLYLMYLGTLTPLSGRTVVKGIAIFFEIVTAAGAFALVYRIGRNFVVAGMFATGLLLLPELVLNGGMWGQTDSTYAAFLVWCAFFVYGRRDILAWVAFSLAFAFKLQAAFLLPFLLLAFVIQRHRWRAPAIGVAVLALTYVPSLVAGRSVPALLSIYTDQANSYPYLTMDAPNYLQWIPNAYFSLWQSASVFIAFGAIALLTSIYLRSRRRPDIEPWLIRTAAAYGILMPFLLPQMHDRYSYAGAIFSFICIAIDRRFAIPAIILQVTAIFAYSGFLFYGQPQPIPLTIVALFQLVAVALVVWFSLVPSGSALPKRSVLS